MEKIELVKYVADFSQIESGQAQYIDGTKEIARVAKESQESLQKAFKESERSIDDLNKDLKAQVDVVKAADTALGNYEKQLESLRAEQKKFGQGTQEYRAIEREIKQVKESASELRKEFGKLDDEQKKSTKSGLTLGKAFQSVKGAWVGLIAAIGAAGGLKVLIQSRIEIDRQTRSVRRLSGETKLASREIVKDIRGLARVYQKDFNEVLIASNTFAKEFGISQSEALEKIRQGFRAGADENGEFLDTLREYPAQFKAAGLSADQAISLIDTSVKAGIFSDKGPDVIKEATIRLRELTPATKKALEGIGLSSKEIEEALKNGTKTIFEVIQQVSGALGKLPATSSEVGTAIADVFGGPGEDAGLRFIRLLESVDGELKIVESDVDNIDKATESWSNAVDRLIDGLTGGLGPAISDIVRVGAQMVDFFASIVETKASDEIRLQKEELNILVGAIENTNKEQQVRVDLINELERKYPGFLENLNAETATNEQLRDRLKEVNALLEQKILTQLKEEELIPIVKESVFLREREKQLLQDIQALEEKSIEERTQGGFLGSQGVDPLIGAKQSLERIREEQARLIISTQKLDEKYGSLVDKFNGSNSDQPGVPSKSVGRSSSDSDPTGLISNLRESLKEINKEINEVATDPNTIQQLLRLRNSYTERIEELLTLDSIDDIPPIDPQGLIKRRIQEALDGAVPESLNIESGANGSESNFWLDVLGVTPEEGAEAVSAMSKTLASFRDLLVSDAKIRANIAEQNINSLDEQLRAQENKVETELRLAELGFANNVQAAQDEQTRLEEIRQQEVQKRQEALREQQRLDSIQQKINLVTSASNLYKALSPLGPLGIGLAVAAIGTMFSSFESSKAQAKQAADEGFYEGGFSDKGGFTGNTGARRESKNLGNKPYKYHGGEYIANHHNTEEFRPMFEAMESGTLGSMNDVIIPSINHYPGLKSSSPSLDMKPVKEAKIRDRSEVMSRAISMTNKSLENRLGSLESITKRHFDWIEETGIPIPMPDGSVKIKGRNRERTIRNERDK